MAAPMHVEFVGGRTGAWRVVAVRPSAGEPLPAVERLAIYEGRAAAPGDWSLCGVVSHQRYVTRAEVDTLTAAGAGLGRPQATCAAFIPIKKNEAWWMLAQDERRAIFEERSRHVAGTLKYLPAIARRLYHARDLGQPFDFLTWFEFAPADRELFEELVGGLRASEEWRYVEREVDLRLERA